VVIAENNRHLLCHSLLKLELTLINEVKSHSDGKIVLGKLGI